MKSKAAVANVKGVVVEMTNLVTRLLGPPEEVERCACLPSPLHRWMIFTTQYFKVYLQRSSNMDLANDFIAYPETLISVGCVNSHGRKPAEISKASPNRIAWLLVIVKSPRDGQWENIIPT